MISQYSVDVVWLVVISFIIAFILAVAVGANDVANSYGTSVGSGVLTFRQACVLATIFETSGSVLIGFKVADTMRKGILDVKLFEGSEKILMMGMLSALIGSAIWLLIATYFRLPVSTTHSIVGSTIGFSLVVNGFKGLQFKALGKLQMSNFHVLKFHFSVKICSSWFISPILSGVIGILIYLAIDRLIARRENPLRAGLFALPIIYGLTIFMNVLSVVLDGSKCEFLKSSLKICSLRNFFMSRSVRMNVLTSKNLKFQCLVFMKHQHGSHISSALSLC